MSGERTSSASLAGSPMAHLPLETERLLLRAYARDDEAEIARRRAHWTPPEPKVKRGYLARYARMVTSASTGAILREEW